jgi:8-oxo-dGTP pyrophosphatase MutT (NUDIX family)
MAQSPGPERAGVVVIRNGRLGLIERVRDRCRFWVVPGGSIEPGESVREAALREAQEELGAKVRLGPLRIRVDHREEDGSIRRCGDPPVRGRVWRSLIVVDGPKTRSDRRARYKVKSPPSGSAYLLRAAALVTPERYGSQHWGSRNTEAQSQDCLRVFFKSQQPQVKRMADPSGPARDVPSRGLRRRIARVTHSGPVLGQGGRLLGPVQTRSRLAFGWR